LSGQGSIGLAAKAVMKLIESRVPALVFLVNA
jgi:hypothetical protein